jgi:hypothetical protein
MVSILWLYHPYILDPLYIRCSKELTISLKVNLLAGLNNKGLFGDLYCFMSSVACAIVHAMA